MSGRIALWVSLLATLAAVGGTAYMAQKVVSLSIRVAVLESRLQAPPPAPPAPPPEVKVSPQEMERLKIREMTDREGQDHLDLLVKTLDFDPEKEPNLREAFAEEFNYYTDAVLRALDDLRKDLPRGQENWLESAAYRKGLQDRMAASDEAVLPMLDPAQTAKYETWRKTMRKSRYELE